MSETELLYLQIKIAELIWLKKIERYKAMQNELERLRIKHLRECRQAESRFLTLHNQRAQSGDVP